MWMRGKEERSCLAWTALGCFLPITASSEDTISSVTEQKYMYLHTPSNIYTTEKKNPSFYKINSRCPTKESKAVNTCRRKDFHTKVTNCDLIVFLLNNLGMTSTMWLMRRSRHCIRYSTLSDPLFSAALPSLGVWRRLSLSMYMTSL